MSRLPDIQLDDRRFQDLVSEARLKIKANGPISIEGAAVQIKGQSAIELSAPMLKLG